jgi:hypothetical protein
MLRRWAAQPRGIRWLAGCAAAVLALAVAWGLFVPLADWLARQDIGSASGSLHETAVDNARGRLLTLLAGLAAAAALVFTALNFSLLRRNSEQADLWQRRTHELTEQGQVTDRYTKAVEQLGSDKPDVRIGGIYALERVARDSSRDHPAVMEVLTAFIREHSREPWPLPRTEEEDADLVESTRPDIQAALTVVGRRNREHDIPSRPINLAGAKLIRADLAGADLGGAKLTRADLSGADLTSADLTSADLREAHLVGANLTHANLTSAGLVRTNLTGAYLTIANLTDAVLGGADLSSADLTNADLTGALLGSADLTGADLGGADLTRAELSGARWPENVPIPGGWELKPGIRRLRPAEGD